MIKRIQNEGKVPVECTDSTTLLTKRLIIWTKKSKFNSTCISKCCCLGGVKNEGHIVQKRYLKAQGAATKNLLSQSKPHLSKLQTTSSFPSPPVRRKIFNSCNITSHVKLNTFSFSQIDRSITQSATSRAICRVIWQDGCKGYPEFK